MNRMLTVEQTRLRAVVGRLRRKQVLYLSVEASHFTAALSGLTAHRLLDLHPLCVLQLQRLKLLDHVRTPTDHRERAECRSEYLCVNESGYLKKKKTFLNSAILYIFIHLNALKIGLLLL